MKNRDATFDIMKGIGILLVIICHIWGWNHHCLQQVVLSLLQVAVSWFLLQQAPKASVSTATDKKVRCFI